MNEKKSNGTKNYYEHVTIDIYQKIITSPEYL